MNTKCLQGLPQTVKIWLLRHEVWLVGSAVEYYLDGSDSEPKDIDLLVPPNQWQAVCQLIDWKVPVLLNSFGGLKIVIDGKTIDLWPQHLEDFLAVRAGSIPCERVARFNPFTVLDISRDRYY